MTSLKTSTRSTTGSRTSTRLLKRKPSSTAPKKTAKKIKANIKHVTSKAKPVQEKHGQPEVTQETMPMISSFEKGHIDYRLQHVLSAHSANECKDDDFTDVWACTFPPAIASKYHELDPTFALDPHVVATVGGDIACFVDCRTAKVVLKYKHLDEDEDFYAIAWTVAQAPRSNDLDDEDGEKENRKQSSATINSSVLPSNCRFWSIVAIAGRGKSIRLIDVMQKTCYKYINGHQDDIHELQFSQSNPTWLISASNDGTVRVWDIAASSRNMDPSTASPTCLGVFESHELPPVSLSITPSGTSYLTGSKEFKKKDEAPLSYQPLKFDSPTQSKKRGKAKSSNSSKNADKAWIVENFHETTLDTVVHLNDDFVVSKGAMDGIIRIWCISDVLKSSVKPKNAKDIPVIATLDSPYNAKERCFFMKGSIHRHGNGPFEATFVDVRIDGSIALYDLEGLQDILKLKKRPKDPLQYDQMLTHSLSDDIIHGVSVSTDGKWLVSVSGNNRIFIWGKEALSL